MEHCKFFIIECRIKKTTLRKISNTVLFYVKTDTKIRIKRINIKEYRRTIEVYILTKKCPLQQTTPECVQQGM